MDKMETHNYFHYREEPPKQDPLKLTELELRLLALEHEVSELKRGSLLVRTGRAAGRALDTTVRAATTGIKKGAAAVVRGVKGAHAFSDIYLVQADLRSTRHSEYFPSWTKREQPSFCERVISDLTTAAVWTGYAVAPVPLWIIPATTNTLTATRDAVGGIIRWSQFCNHEWGLAYHG